MEKNIYHGSNVEVSQPRILQNGFYKDFGYGFYCTNIEKQAKRWAITRKGDSVVNKYSYEENSVIKILSFEKMSDIPKQRPSGAGVLLNAFARPGSAWNI